MKKLAVLCAAILLGSVNAFANISDYVCSATTWKGETLSIDLETFNGDGSGPATQEVSIYLGEKEITHFSKVTQAMKNFGSEQDVFMLNTISGENYRGSVSFYWPEQDPDAETSVVVADIQVKFLNKPGYVINVEALEMTCPK